MLSDQWSLRGHYLHAIEGESDSSWDLYAGASYAFSDRYALLFGYLHREVNYDAGDFVFDVEFSGPTLGFSFAF